MTHEYYIIALRTSGDYGRPTLYVDSAESSRGVAGLEVVYRSCTGKRDQALKMNKWMALKVAAICNLEADQILDEQGVSAHRAFVELAN